MPQQANLALGIALGIVILTADPLFRLVFTQPLIGNYGVPSSARDENGLLKYFESPVRTFRVVSSQFVAAGVSGQIFGGTKPHSFLQSSRDLGHYDLKAMLTARHV